MALSSEIERQRYSKELAAYTLRQFYAACSSQDQPKLAAAKPPAAHTHDQSRLGQTPLHCIRVTLANR
jgi:hypothetical protein